MRKSRMEICRGHQTVMKNIEEEGKTGMEKEKDERDERRKRERGSGSR